MSVHASAAVYSRTARPAHGGVLWRLALVVVIALTVTAIVLLSVSAEVVALAASLLVNFDLALFFVAFLLFQDQQVPVFESGTLWVAATVVYASFPFLGFIVAGMKWTADMDNRLQQYPFVTSEIVWFAWQYTLYLAAFVVAYLAVRRRARVPSRVFERIRPNTAVALVVGFLALSAFKWILYLVYGVRLDTSHDSAEIVDMIARISRIPLPVWQVSSHLLDAILLGQMGIVILLLTQWRRRPWVRVVIVLWLLVEIAQVAVRETGRAWFVLLLFCVVLLYHRLVQPFSLKKVAVGSALFLSGFIVLGVLRLHGGSLNPRTAFTTMNEFQALFGTAFDLYQRKHLGTLGHVPWQVYAVDLYLEIPRQLLPFEKIDPAIWYLDVLGVRDQGYGFMFGVMAQAMLGLGWIELILRGAVLGILYGLLHRWYVRRAARLWPTMLYVFVSIWSFYTFRATTFWCLHFVVYQFIPFFLMIKFVEVALERGGLANRFRARPSS
jgi:hypothetical protein